MATIPQLKRIRLEEIPDAPAWAEGLVYTLNLFMESVNTALRNQLTFGDNIAGRIYSTTFTTKSNYTTGGWDDIKIPKTWTTAINGVLLLQFFKADNPTEVLTTTPTVSFWVTDGSQINIKYITGLVNSTKYFVRLLLI